MTPTAEQSERWPWLVAAGVVLAALLLVFLVVGHVTWHRAELEHAIQCEEPCYETGRCHPRWIDVISNRYGDCIAKSPSDCEQTCRLQGLCRFEGETCVAANDADCARSKFCKALGKCHVVSGDTSQGIQSLCGARDDADCAPSDMCTAAGRCTMRDNACEAH